MPSWELNVRVELEGLSAYGEIIPSSVWNYPGYAVCHGNITKEQCWIGGGMDDTFDYGVAPLDQIAGIQCGDTYGSPIAMGVEIMSYISFGGLVPSYIGGPIM